MIASDECNEPPSHPDRMMAMLLVVLPCAMVEGASVGSAPPVDEGGPAWLRRTRSGASDRSRSSRASCRSTASRVSTEVIAGATSPRSRSPRSWATPRSPGCRSSPACTPSCRSSCSPILGSSRHLVVGADSATAMTMATGLLAMGLTAIRQVETASLAALMCAVLLVLARLCPRVHRQLPVAQRPDRVPDRRGHPGRDDPARGRPRRGPSLQAPCRSNSSARYQENPDITSLGDAGGSRSGSGSSSSAPKRINPKDTRAR